MSMTAFKHRGMGVKFSHNRSFGYFGRLAAKLLNDLENTAFFQCGRGSRAAFTLAEVLITLGIIGIVAAMTLPTVISNYQKQETISKLKKVYAMLGNTTSMAIAEYDDTRNWELGNNLDWATGKAFAEKYIMPYLKIARVCENNSTKECNYPIKRLNGQSFNNYTEFANSYRFYLVDGTFVCVAANHKSQHHDKLVQIIFDINGERNPNRVGKDVFFLEYFIKPASTNTVSGSAFQGRMLPANLDYQDRNQILGTGNNDFCNKSKDGKGCLAVIFMDGWQIKPDYPW